MGCRQRLAEQGDQLFRQRDYAGAWSCYRQSLESREGSKLGRLSATWYDRLTRFLETLVAEDPDNAFPFLEDAMSIWNEAFGERHPETASLRANLGYLYKRQGRFEEALTCYRAAVGIFEIQPEPDADVLATLLNNLAALYREMGRLDAAQEAALKGLELWQKEKEKSPPA